MQFTEALAATAGTRRIARPVAGLRDGCGYFVAEGRVVVRPDATGRELPAAREAGGLAAAVGDAGGRVGGGGAMTNEELEQYGILLCEGGGDCDFCRQDAADGDYFWRRTSYEYVEGDYYCRACATREAQGIELFTQTGVPQWIQPAP